MLIEHFRGGHRIRHLMILIAMASLGLATWADSRKPGTPDPTKHQWNTIVGSFPWEEATALDPYSEVVGAAPIALVVVPFFVRWGCQIRYRLARRTQSRRRWTALRSASGD